MNEVAANDTPTRRWASGTSPSAWPQVTNGGGVNALRRGPTSSTGCLPHSHGGALAERPAQAWFR
jgi:hypothetical protein